MADFERRFQTGFREEPFDEPGLVQGEDGNVSVVRIDGTRTLVPSVADQQLVAPFAGASADADHAQVVMVAPYYATIIAVSYVPLADETYDDDPLDARTWELVNLTADDTPVVASALYDGTQFTEVAGVMAGKVAYPLNVLNDVDQLVVNQGDVFEFRSLAEGGVASPADPGGILVVQFFDSFNDQDFDSFNVE